MPTLKILSAFTPAGGVPAVIAEREPVVGEIVRDGNGVEFTWTPIQEEPPPAPRPRVLSRLEFLRLFSKTEVGTAVALRATDATVATFWVFYEAAQEYHKGDQDTVDGLAALRLAGVFDTERETEILAAWPTA